MNMGNYKRVLASAAVLGVAVVGPLAAPAQAAPGGNSGHAKAGQAKAGQAKSSGQAKSGHAPKGGQAKGHSSAGGSHPSGNAGGGNGAAHANGPSGQANGHSNGQGNGHSNAGGAPAPAASPPSSPAPDKGPQADKGTKGDKGSKGDKGGKGGDPAGNNGTVKIETSPAGKDAPNNVPHVGCTFQLEWYGFDEGEDIISTVDFQMHSPTSDVVLGGYEPTEVFVGGDPASGAGTDSGFDGRQTYTLSFDGEPHAQQGYHVKLTIHTPGSQGADTKHKVFWVEPCEDETPPEGEEETPPKDEETPPTVEGKQETDKDHKVEVAGKQQVAPTSGTPAEVPTAVAAGAEGAPMGTSPLAHLIVTLGGLLAALGLLLRRRTA